MLVICIYIYVSIYIYIYRSLGRLFSFQSTHADLNDRIFAWYLYSPAPAPPRRRFRSRFVRGLSAPAFCLKPSLRRARGLPACEFGSYIYSLYNRLAEDPISMANQLRCSSLLHACRSVQISSSVRSAHQRVVVASRRRHLRSKTNNNPKSKPSLGSKLGCVIFPPQKKTKN